VGLEIITQWGALQFVLANIIRKFILVTQVLQHCKWESRCRTLTRLHRLHCGTAVVGLSELVHIGCNVGLLWLD